MGWSRCSARAQIVLRVLPFGNATITNLEPCASLPICDVRPEALLGYHALQLHFADTLKQCHTALQGGQRVAAEMRQEARTEGTSVHAFDLMSRARGKSLPLHINKSRARVLLDEWLLLQFSGPSGSCEKLITYSHSNDLTWTPRC